MSNKNKSVWLKPVEFAEIAGVSIPTITSWCREKLLKAVLTPKGRWKIHKSEVEKYTGTTVEGK